MEQNRDKIELMLIDGKWVEAADGRVIPVENPSLRGSVIASVPRSSAVDVNLAVESAARAFEKWRLVTARERGLILLKIADAIENQAEDIARTIAMENGNAIRTQSRPEAKRAADIIRYFGCVASEAKGTTLPLGEKKLGYTRREPLGVVAGITPWNAPVSQAALKIGPALAAGNTMVLKPASEAPLSVLKLVRVCSGFLPAGVLNAITGYGGECGQPLAEHPLVNKLSFTGSTEVGKSIMRAAADRIVPVSLELGGKSPQIVFPDVDDDRVAAGVIGAMRFARQGQSCSAGSRLFVHHSIFDSFMDKVAKKLSALKVGDPLDEATDMGAIVSKKQFNSVCAYIEDGLRQEGAKLILGGLPPKEGRLASGYYLEPTVFTHTHNNWRLMQEEIFGPVLVAIPWEDEKEAIRMANDSHYGLAAYVWTHDISKGLRTAHAIQAGWIQVNQGLGLEPGHVYGGYKQSGIGREWSLEGMLNSFTQIKNVIVNLEF